MVLPALSTASTAELTLAITSAAGCHGEFLPKWMNEPLRDPCRCGSVGVAASPCRLVMSNQLLLEELICLLLVSHVF